MSSHPIDAAKIRAQCLSAADAEAESVRRFWERENQRKEVQAALYQLRDDANGEALRKALADAAAVGAFLDTCAARVMAIGEALALFPANAARLDGLQATSEEARRAQQILEAALGRDKGRVRALLAAECTSVAAFASFAHALHETADALVSPRPWVQTDPVTAFRDYLRQVRAGDELAGMAGAVRGPAYWQAQAAQLWEEWRKNFPADCPPPAPPRPGAWKEAEYLAAIDTLIRRLNELRPAPLAITEQSPADPKPESSTLDFVAAATHSFKFLLDALNDLDDAERANPRDGGLVSRCFQVVRARVEDCTWYATRRLDDLAVHYLRARPGEWGPELLDVVQNPQRASVGDDYMRGVQHRYAGLGKLALLVENDGTRHPRFDERSGGRPQGTDTAGAGREPLRERTQPHSGSSVASDSEAMMGRTRLPLDQPSDPALSHQPLTERLAWMRGVLENAAAEVGAVVRAARVTTPPYDPADDLRRIVFGAYGSWNNIIAGDAKVPVAPIQDEADAMNAIWELQRRLAVLAPAPSAEKHGSTPVGDPIASASREPATPLVPLPVPNIPVEAYATSSALRAAADAEKNHWHKRRDMASRALRNWLAGRPGQLEQTAEALLGDIDCHWCEEWCNTLGPGLVCPSPCTAPEIRQWCDLQYSVLALVEHARKRHGWFELREPLPEDMDLSPEHPFGPGRCLHLQEAAPLVLCFLDGNAPTSRSEWEAAVSRLQPLKAREPDAADQADEAEMMSVMVVKLWHALRDVGDPPPEPQGVSTIAAGRAALDLAKRWLGKEQAPPGGSQGTPPAMPQKMTRRERRALWMSQAMLMIRDHPDWSDKDIAMAVGINPSQLTPQRCPEYQAAKALAIKAREELLRGHVETDRDTGNRTVEAYDMDDPAERDWDNE
jgi:hypothetical protein